MLVINNIDDIELLKEDVLNTLMSEFSKEYSDSKEMQSIFWSHIIDPLKNKSIVDIIGIDLFNEIKDNITTINTDIDTTIIKKRRIVNRSNDTIRCQKDFGKKTLENKTFFDLYHYKDMEKTIKCEGNQNRRMSHHQIIKGVTQYSQHFQNYNGEPREVADILACLMWDKYNQDKLNGKHYFKIDELHNLLEEKKSKELSINCVNPTTTTATTTTSKHNPNISKKQRIFKRYYDLANDDLMSTMRVQEGTKTNPKYRSNNFWKVSDKIYKKCENHAKKKAENNDDDTILFIPSKKKLVKEMKKWNEKNEMEYFRF